jgi:hypothetical protein
MWLSAHDPELPSTERSSVDASGRWKEPKLRSAKMEPVLSRRVALPLVTSSVRRCELHGTSKVQLLHSAKDKQPGYAQTFLKFTHLQVTSSAVG